jgi:polyhydroxybutyrate depolymerase
MKAKIPLLVALLASSSGSIAAVVPGSLQVDGVERTWELFVPDDYSASKTYPLVVDLHGTGGNPENQARNSGLRTLAAEKGFLVVNAAGKYKREPSGGNTWNVDLDPKGVNDVRFIRDMVAKLRTDYSIDPRRIYSTGFSGGARMSSRIACDLSDTFAAVALVGGVRFPERCTPAQPVAILAIHSEDDEVNHFEHRSDSPAYWPVGVNSAVSSWAQYASCSMPRERTLSPGVVKLEYQGCKPGADLVFIRLKDGGHTWPGSLASKNRQPSAQLAATEEVWAFFASHARKQ